LAFADAEAQQQRLAKLLETTVGATYGQVAALTAEAKALEKLGVVTAGSITQVQSQLATFNLQVINNPSAYACNPRLCNSRKGCGSIRI
jgi:hypothetical protein